MIAFINKDNSELVIAVVIFLIVVISISEVIDRWNGR